MKRQRRARCGATAAKSVHLLEMRARRGELLGHRLNWRRRGSHYGAAQGSPLGLLGLRKLGCDCRARHQRRRPCIAHWARNGDAGTELPPISHAGLALCPAQHSLFCAAAGRTSLKPAN